MIKLSGILDYSMGGFLCLRGFADYKMLSNASKENQDIQRTLIEEHKGEMAEFLNNGEYRFFPEVVLSISLTTGDNFDEVDKFFSTVRENGPWREKLGDFDISIFNHNAGDRNKIAHISFEESKYKLNRIDGNHRLSAADEVKKEFKVPFCLIFCRNADEENQYSRAIFHNINAKQIPLNLEQNLKVILESSQVFSDRELSESFGTEYYLARKTLESIDFSYFPTIRTYIENQKCSFFVELYKFLIKNGLVAEDVSAVDVVRGQMYDIETALTESNIVAVTTNIAVIGALSYYRIANLSKYRGFLSWIKKNNIGNVKKLHIEDVINLYDEIYLHVPQKVFLARWYPAETDPAYTQSVYRINAIKDVCEELHLDLTDLGTKTDGAFDIRDVMYHNIRECDIFIADLTGARHNVMIEVGYALKHIDTGRMIFYFQETDSCKSVPFDVNHFAYDKINDSAEIKTKTKARIETVLEKSLNGEL